ncbi:DUF222 domain-containing protein, partial [Gordonia sp. N1V]|uniref:DUF222 domain-containing protein n=1 Tax=Gordonia sp. N1V TaxID=3034163 RepID=UPI0023E16D78
EAVLRAGLDVGLGPQSHRGLPPHLIIKASLSDLIAQTGMGVTATGTLLPIRDVIALAAQCQPWLAVFDDHTSLPLYLGRAFVPMVEVPRSVSGVPFLPVVEVPRSDSDEPRDLLHRCWFPTIHGST